MALNLLYHDVFYVQAISYGHTVQGNSIGEFHKERAAFFGALKTSEKSHSPACISSFLFSIYYYYKPCLASENSLKRGIYTL